jgi:hypothetical protein
VSVRIGDPLLVLVDRLAEELDPFNLEQICLARVIELIGKRDDALVARFAGVSAAIIPAYAHSPVVVEDPLGGSRVAGPHRMGQEVVDRDPVILADP